jgi:hypothetical protein
MSERLARIIHERFYCNRQYAVATGGLAAQSVKILQEYVSLPHGSKRPFHGRILAIS